MYFKNAETYFFRNLLWFSEDYCYEDTGGGGGGRGGALDKL